jgi:hypothetical protein
MELEGSVCCLQKSPLVSLKWYPGNIYGFHNFKYHHLVLAVDFLAVHLLWIKPHDTLQIWMVHWRSVSLLCRCPVNRLHRGCTIYLQVLRSINSLVLTSHWVAASNLGLARKKNQMLFATNPNIPCANTHSTTVQCIVNPLNAQAPSFDGSD